MNWYSGRGLCPPRASEADIRAESPEYPSTFRGIELAGLVLLILVVLATRLPWLDAGYGIDPDCSRVITAAQHIAQTGEYELSRGPAYPVHEYMVAAVVNGGPVLTNGLSALFGCVALLFFALILRRLGVKAYLLLSLAFAFVPVIFVNCVSTIDYVPALAFTLAGTYYLLLKQPVVSGLGLGLAIGTRVTSGAMLLPLAIWSWLDATKSRRTRDVLLLVIATLVTGCVTYLPAFLKYGTSFFAFVDWKVYPELDRVLLLGVKGVWGYSARSVGAALLLLLLVGGLLAHRAWKSRVYRHALIASGMVVILYTIAFLRAPFEAGYLVPVVPFVLLGIILLYRPTYQWVIAAALIPTFLLAPGEHDPVKPAAITHDHRIRMERHAFTMRIIERTSKLPAGSLVVVAWELPQILIYLDAQQREQHPYLYFIQSEEQMRGYREQGHEVYFLEGLDYHNMQTHGVDIVKLGAKPLFAEDSTLEASGGQ